MPHYDPGSEDRPHGGDAENDEDNWGRRRAQRERQHGGQEDDRERDVDRNRGVDRGRERSGGD
ncbi:hypothetical protein ACFQDG_02510, partial [Natronoarchaeum mannanilyticum]